MQALSLCPVVVIIRGLCIAEGNHYIDQEQQRAKELAAKPVKILSPKTTIMLTAYIIMLQKPPPHPPPSPPSFCFSFFFFFLPFCFYRSALAVHWATPESTSPFKGFRGTAEYMQLGLLKASVKHEKSNKKEKNSVRLKTVSSIECIGKESLDSRFLFPSPCA